MSFDRLFRSDRLVYRAAQDTPEERAFLRESWSDPATYAQATNKLLVPPNAKDLDKDMESLPKALLGVVICLAVEDLDRGLPAGTRLGWLALDSSTLVRHHRGATLSITIAEPYQGKGYGNEAINWVLDWAFTVAGLHSVRLVAFSYNERAVKLYERIGFVREGIRRESLYYDCKWHDHILFSMLDREWAVLRGRVL